MKFLHNGERRRRRGGQRDAAEGKGQIDRHAGKMKYNGKNQRNHRKGSERLGKGGSNQRRAIVFELFPDQLGAQHQAKGTLHPGGQQLVPARPGHRLGEQVQRVGPQQHTGNQPAQNGGHFHFGQQLARHHGQAQCGQPAQSGKQGGKNIHIGSLLKKIIPQSDVQNSAPVPGPGPAQRSGAGKDTVQQDVQLTVAALLMLAQKGLL